MSRPMNRRRLGLPVRSCIWPLVLLVGGLTTAGVRAQSGRRPAVPVDPVDGIVEAFKSHNVVMLPGGHGSKQFHDLLLRILRDPPVDWDNVVSKQDLRKWTVRRDSFAADLIHSEVIARGRRALVVYGHLHFPRREILSNYDMSNWQAQTMTSLIESRQGARVFVMLAEGTREVVKLQADMAAWAPLSMAIVRGTVLGGADFTVFVGDGDRFVIRGVDDFAKIPRDQHKPMLMEEQVDAILWNPNAPPNPVLLSPATCADPAYLPMRTARIMLAGLPVAEIEAVKRACAGR